MADDTNHEELKNKKAKSKKRKREHSEEKDPSTDEAGSSKVKRPSESEDTSSPQKPQKTGSVQTAPSVVWSSELDRKLLEAIETSLSSVVKKGKAKLIFPRDIDWSSVLKALQEAPEEMSAKDVRARWTLLAAKVRKLRTAEEVLADVKGLYEKGMLCVSNGTRKPASAKKSVDPNLPKKPFTAFFMFMNEKRPRLREKYPELGVSDFAKKLGKKWKELPEEKKQKYTNRYKNELEQYNEDLLKYLGERFPDENPPPSAFELWKVGAEKKLRKERPDISDRKLSKKLKRRWENMEEEGKSAFEKKANHSLLTFQKKLLNTVNKAS